jgi:outer membrane protein assembly factor BamB
VNDGYYIVVSSAPTTRYCAFGALIVCTVVIAWGACPEARQSAETSTETSIAVSAAKRREAILRAWRNAKPTPVPLVGTEAAWTVTLPAVPSAPGALDDRRVYIPLRSNLLVALNRETGVLEWSRPIETTSPLLAADGSLYVVQAGRLHALDVQNGTDRWAVPVDGAITAPLAWDGGSLIAIATPGEALAFRGSDGQLAWRRPLGAASSHPAVPGGSALYFSLADGRLLALASATGAPLWEQKVTGTISEPAVARDRVFVGSTDNFFYAFDADTGRPEWKWRNGGDVIGAAADGELVYFVSLDNIVRAVNRGNGNQRWKKPTGTRPVGPPRAFDGVVVVPGLMPAITVFVGQTGAVMGTQAAAGDLVGPPLIDSMPKPFRVSLVSITREGVVEALRPAGLMFREAALIPMTALPGRLVAREKLQ